MTFIDSLFVLSFANKTMAVSFFKRVSGYTHTKWSVLTCYRCSGNQSL